MRALGVLALTAFLGGCANSHVTLLDGETGMPVGSVVVLDQAGTAERSVLASADTRAAIGRKTVWRRHRNPARFAALTGAIPRPPAHFTLYFLEGSTDLAPGSDLELKRMFEEIARRPGVEVQITGHTDTLGASEDNDALSLARAGEVRQTLVKQGLDPDVTRVAGRGERELLVTTEDGVREDRNRRVEIIVR